MTAFFLGSKLLLAQGETGHRAGTDAVLLAAAVPRTAQGRILDIGAGAGAAGLCLLARGPGVSVDFIERDAQICGLARQNIVANDFSSRARVLEADVLVASSRRSAGLTDGQADIVVTNPPFYAPLNHRLSPDAKKASAHAGAAGPWLKACAALLRPGGVLYMIQRPENLPELLTAATGRIGAIKILPVFSRADKPAIRLLLTGRKGSRAPLAFVPELTLQNSDGEFSPHARAIHSGEADIDWV